VCSSDLGGKPRKDRPEGWLGATPSSTGLEPKARSRTVHKTRLAILALPALGLLAVASPAMAAGSTAADWQMNEKTGPMKDSSGNGNNSSMMSGVTRNGSTYHFNGTGRVVVPTSASLVPGSRNFTLTARLHLTQLGGGQNFVQKNTYSQSGTQIKLETSGNHLHCRVAGNSGVASVWGWGLRRRC